MKLSVICSTNNNPLSKIDTLFQYWNFWCYLRLVKSILTAAGGIFGTWCEITQCFNIIFNVVYFHILSISGASKYLKLTYFYTFLHNEIGCYISNSKLYQVCRIVGVGEENLTQWQEETKLITRSARLALSHA